MTAVILCGGEGRRLPLKDREKPKPMVEICGVPCLERQIDALKEEGVTDFILVAGFKSEAIVNYFGRGERAGVSISYVIEEKPKGTAGSLFELEIDEDFIFLNGDLVFDFDLRPMLDFHRKNEALITCFSHKTTHPSDSTLIDCDEDGLIRRFILKGEENPNETVLSNAGIFVISPGLLKMFSFDGRADFDKDVLFALAGQKVFAYQSCEYVKDIGTPGRLEQAGKDLTAGLPRCFRKGEKKKAVFLDRDGTLNRHDGYITKKEQLRIIEGVPEALNIIHSKGFLCVVVTNQPTVARGENTLEEIGEINRRLEFLLAKSGAFVDDIYFCPHHPDRGFEGENPDFKIECKCRKPKPGMLLKAAEEHNIDLSLSFMAGDSETDVRCALNAGAMPVRISGDFQLIDFARTL